MVKNPPANAGDTRDWASTPGSGRSPGGRHGKPTPVFLPRVSHGQKSLVGYGPQGWKTLDMTKGTWHAGNTFIMKNELIPLPWKRHFSCLQKTKTNTQEWKYKSLLFIPVVTIMTTFLHFYFLYLYCPGQREKFLPFYTWRIKLHILFWAMAFSF